MAGAVGWVDVEGFVVVQVIVVWVVGRYEVGKVVWWMDC